MAEGLSEEDKQQLKEEQVKLALRTVRFAKQNVRVDTGRLRSSITAADSEGILQEIGPDALPGDGVNTTNDEFLVRVGSNVDYAEHVEFLVEAFLRPAAQRAISESEL